MVRASCPELADGASLGKCRDGLHACCRQASSFFAVSRKPAHHSFCSRHSPPSQIRRHLRTVLSKSHQVSLHTAADLVNQPRPTPPSRSDAAPSVPCRVGGVHRAQAPGAQPAVPAAEVGGPQQRRRGLAASAHVRPHDVAELPRDVQPGAGAQWHGVDYLGVRRRKPVGSRMQCPAAHHVSQCLHLGLGNCAVQEEALV